ncbi:hypothetical protein GTA08_BOTSDO02048 [Botryosphaeria dothidea]|uniref:Retrotransposon gag domain-containing protein n=1 Tax=Botryosphaeria dothidea TaxID=55169 RepID=A0A8H4N3E7_9PEZI|nr:hypothetical protein GTA08_BOTSDO02048 [Botryosphaeria dothidea]
MSPQEHGQELQAQENQETKRLLLQMMARMDTLTQEVIQLKEEKEELLKVGGAQTPSTQPSGEAGEKEARVAGIASDPPAPESGPTSHPTKTGPTKNLGPLAEFSGNREELEPWIAQAQAKLVVDYTSCTEATKFFMLHNRLRGEAARQLQPWVQASTNTTSMTAQCLLDQLRLSFGDPHVQEKAQRKLHKLRQTNKPFMEYFTEFRKLVLEAGGTNWPDEILKAYLEAGLSQELQRSMIGLGNTSQSFEDYCTELKRVSDQLEAFNLRNTGKKPQQGWQQDWWRGQNKVGSAGSTGRQPGSKPKPTTPQQDKMEWEPTGPARAAQGRRVKWVDEQEMQRRKDEGRCLRCGDSMHRVAQCPWLPPRRPARLAKPTQQEEHVGPELEDLEDESSSQQSEN